MRSIERNKIAAACLLIALVIVFGQATPPQLPLEGYIEGKVEIVGDYPKVGEIFEVVYRIRLKRVDDLIRGYLGGDYCAVIRGVPFEAIEIVGKDKFLFTGFAVGEWKEFRSRCQILKPLNQIIIDGDVRPVYQGKVYGPIATEGYLLLYLIDSKTGQYGTKEEYDKQLRQKAEWWYDPAGEFTGDPVHPDCAKKNREIIAKMQEINSNLTDWEALYLHYDGIQALMGGMGIQETMDEERWRFLLEMGWLEQYKAGKAVKNKWLNKMIKKYKDKSLTKEQGLNPKFFRGDSDNIDNNGSGSDSTKTRWSYIYFKGQFRYKKHKYNKDQGLLTQTDDMPICSVLVRVRSYWSGSGGSRWSFRTNTDANGNFFATLSWEVPQYIWISAHPLIYFWGPTSANRVIKVSDPTPTSYLTWRDPIDTTIFLLPRVQGGVEMFYTNTDTFDFGTMYVDSFISGTNPQPKSGAANIFETYLHARTFMSPAPTWPLRCLWEPGYDTTGYRSDTIRVSGNYPSNTDEWDDDILLHEFGHYLMDHYAQLPPIVTDTHWWHKEYPNDTSLAYSEGWATFFSGRARVSSGIDSLFINSHYIGAGLPWYWLNIEDPWKGSYFSPDSFEGGPWCEGAVAGALWDIYDSHNEIPYLSYPDSLNGVWFPDTALADSLTMGPDEIWAVFDDYNPPGDPTNCWTIFDFRSGWNYYNYDHDFALNQILLHHRIRDSIPAAPIGLSANQEGKYVRLYWNKNSESDLKGYRVYRRMYNKTWGHWDDWAWRADKNSPTDTTYLDSKVISTVYRYRVTACDSLGNESDYSDSVQISVKNGIEPEIGKLLANTQTIFSNVQGMEISILQESKEITFKIYDCCGRIVNKQKIKLNNCDLLKINLRDAKNNHLPNGVYFLHLKADNGDEATRKFVVIR